MLIGTIASTIALMLKEQVTVQSHIWGLQTGQMMVEQGDLATDDTVKVMVANADLVLVNNKLFGEKLNEKLELVLKNVKPGASVVHTYPLFLQGTNRSGRTRGQKKSIFNVEPSKFEPGDVSWSDNDHSLYYWAVKKGSTIAA
ncbi:histone methylation DOT1 [Rhodocollybia butyracea]|uniref:Histone-lysine N-methyltransferase, H3 lysine-79 specific n=1 Tax=Rhodocollybia butyracea TaxID=206335 RepID=A0A9P5PJ04_9AGAR|nr:histone methylation DOT1 [Rhodocollybia butyracea]